MNDSIDYAIQVLRQVEAGDGVFVGQCADAIRGLESIAASASAEPVAKITGADEYGPILKWTKHWSDLVGSSLYAAPRPIEAPAQAAYCPSRFGKQPHAFNHQKCGYCGTPSPAIEAPAQAVALSAEQEREAFKDWFDRQWQNNDDTGAYSAWMARAALSADKDPK